MNNRIHLNEYALDRAIESGDSDLIVSLVDLGDPVLLNRAFVEVVKAGNTRAAWELLDLGADFTYQDRREVIDAQLAESGQPGVDKVLKFFQKCEENKLYRNSLLSFFDNAGSDSAEEQEEYDYEYSDSEPDDETDHSSLGA